MRLLYITQKLHDQDTFIVHWIREFVRCGYEVHLIVLEWKPENVRLENFTIQSLGCKVYSLGKEEGLPKWRQVLRFYRYIFTIQCDRVFLHLNAVWGLLGAPKWMITRTPVYTWYTHYVLTPSVWLLGKYGKRFFCATPQSLPQFTGNPKKIVTGHGIDTHFWHQRENVCHNPYALLTVHRLSRSKRLELNIRALALLPEQYTLDVYGIRAQEDYAQEMKALTKKLDLQARVQFKGTIAFSELPTIYSQRKFLLNMASETIDKTMVEAMTCGCYPVTTKQNAAAIGIPFAPADTPESIAEFIAEWVDTAILDPSEMFRIVDQQHSLETLIKKLDAYIRPGN